MLEIVQVQDGQIRIIDDLGNVLGTPADPVRVDPTGTTAQPVVGPASGGVAPVGNPVLTAGYDGVNVRTKLTDTSGRARIVGAAASGVAVVGDPVLVGGSDGVDVRTFLADTSSRQVVVGPATTGSPTGGVLNVQGVDVAVSAAALGALNAAATITINGQSGAGFQLAAGTLVGTLVAEVSYEVGTALWNQIPFWNQTTQAFLNNLVFGAANTDTGLAILVPPGASRVRVRVSAYSAGTANATVRGSNVHSPVSIVATIDGNKATYSAAITGLVFAASATDIFTISGSASKLVRVASIVMTATQTVGGRRDVQLVKRSTANTGGASTLPTVVPHDSADPPGTAVVAAYTANPTLGTLVGRFRSRRALIDAAGASGGTADCTSWDLGTRNSKAGVLRGVAESFGVNMNGVTSTGNNCAVCVEWTEE